MAPAEGPYDWYGKRVLVTGATGFVGGRLAARLGSLDAEVHAVSRRPQPQASGEVWHTADLTDPEAAGNLIRSARPDVLFHLASEVSGTRDANAVLPTLHANLGAAVNLLTAVATTRPGTRVVLAGSVEESREGDATPCSPYAAAKTAATSYARMFHGLWGVPVSVLRVAMVYGPGNDEPRRLVPYVTRALLRGEDPALSSGTRLIDWVYVEDVVDAFLAAAAAEKAAGGVFDVGAGERVSIRETVERLARIVGGSGRPNFGALPDRPLDNPQIADIASAEEVLGWSPATPLGDGLRATVAWYADRSRDAAASV
ncbi:NAD-dependent epimerase/dehydratase family protein [Spongiactinospora sp. TRM90649]|uniref:NAD-dependent epimerase/dehydratase family protein n=1 Tax=Spongiactinospora sp. TRM90649 TaxID=3031114 RepID=UPI0023F6F5D1|nr:NAD-dependent epimerase/dehydratase family protein [Spongiactinospora sp. TRM90649]MDF5755027.1 NAD-dependent epimerase/dehydratase family protein [Spongiactinospora sp. TRM90649]